MALDKTDQFLSKSITGSVVEFSDDDDELISDFLGGLILDFRPPGGIILKRKKLLFLLMCYASFLVVDKYIGNYDNWRFNQSFWSIIVQRKTNNQK